MQEQELIRRYPRLFHMAVAGSWPSIRQYGLLTTEQLVASSDLDEKSKTALLTRRRSESAQLRHPVLGAVTVRDQAPLRPTYLQDALTDMSVPEWLRVLNSRVFFWLHPQRLQTLLNARLYRSREQDVLTIDTASLFDAHRSSVRLSAINSGATLWPNSAPRGSTTFLPVSDYPFDQRRRGRTDVTAVAELAVIDGVPDLRSHVVAVDRWRGSTHLGSVLST